MRKLMSLTAAAAMLVAVPLAAEALPIAGPGTSGDTGITLVSGGCGSAFHRGPFGGCRPNRIFVRPRVVCRIVGLIPHRVCRRVW